MKNINKEASVGAAVALMVIFSLSLAGLLYFGAGIAKAATTCSMQSLGGTPTDISAGRLDAEQNATPFEVSFDCSVTQATLDIRKWNAPADNVQYVIYSDTGGGTPNAVLGTSDSYPASSITTSYAPHTIVFSTPVSLVAGTTYWLALKRTGALSNVAWYSAGAYNASGSHGFGPGVSKFLLASVWASNGGYPFETFDITGDPISAPTSTASTTVTVAEANQQFFQGVFAFLFGMCFVIWLFRHRK